MPKKVSNRKIKSKPSISAAPEKLKVLCEYTNDDGTVDHYSYPVISLIAYEISYYGKLGDHDVRTPMTHRELIHEGWQWTEREMEHDVIILTPEGLTYTLTDYRKYEFSPHEKLTLWHDDLPPR